MLKADFINVCKTYARNLSHIQNLWNEIQAAYRSRNRYYHTYAHLQYMHRLLLPVKHEITNWDNILFALIYHDIVYNPGSSTNEEDSATIMSDHLAKINVPHKKIVQCQHLILATKHHPLTKNQDIAFLLDADMAILGSQWRRYRKYCQQIRKEYAVFSEDIYVAGRLKVLANFLSKPAIFQSSYFFLKYEERARQNIIREMNQLRTLRI